MSTGDEKVKQEPSRRSPGRPSFAPERFVDAALELVDIDGADALSMRALAQRLDSGTATLYRHFGSRAHLVAQVVDRVFGEVDLNSRTLTDRSWQHSCTAIANAMFAALRKHPAAARLLLEHTPLGPNAMMLREKGLGLFLDNGFTPDLAARSYATLSRYVLGFAIQLAEQPDGHEASDADAFHGVDPARFPATLAAADYMPVALEDEFDFGLGLIIDGLARARRKAMRS